MFQTYAEYATNRNELFAAKRPFLLYSPIFLKIMSWNIQKRREKDQLIVVYKLFRVFFCSAL